MRMDDNIRSLSRIDRGFGNMPMTKLRDFKSRAATVRDLGDPQATTLPHV